MLRLRTTVVLSVLALAIGLGGTQWLSDQTAVESPAVLATATPRVVPHRHRSRPEARPERPMRDADPLPVRRSMIANVDTAPGTVAAPPPELVPIAMPSEHGTSYETLRGHLDGRVVVHLSVDGEGAVTAAAVVQSSGDNVLDAHALRSVRGWRFAVPPGYPAGLSADLPMQFSSHDNPVASAP